MKLIPLGRSGRFAAVDDADFSRVNRYRWRATRRGRKWYAMRTPRVAGHPTAQKRIYMHRFIAGDVGIIDHEDGDGLNNQRHNLRVATKAQNTANSDVSDRSESGVKNVRWNKANRKWIAYAKADQRCIHLGSFADLKEAAYAAHVASVVLFGEFANCNRDSSVGLDVVQRRAIDERVTARIRVRFPQRDTSGCM